LVRFSSTAPPPPEVYTLSLHDALPILLVVLAGLVTVAGQQIVGGFQDLRDQAVDGFEQFTDWLAEGPLGLDSTTISHWLDQAGRDRKSTRLNSSHVKISYAVFCLKTKI